MFNKIEQTVATLKKASDQYYNDGESFLTDAEYDALERELRALDPTNPFLLGVGSTVRGAKVKLPFPMPSLTQAYKGDELRKWIDDAKLNNEKIVVSDKLDGSSLMLVYGDSGDLQIAFSRGDGSEGQDVTRHVKKMKHAVKKAKQSMVVRCEVVMPEDLFVKVKPQIEKAVGRPYKNSRNFVAGQMNAEDSVAPFYDNVKVISYEIMWPKMGKVDQYALLEKNGFEIARHTVVKGSALNAAMLDAHTQTQIKSSIYTLDGVVVDVDDLAVREKLEEGKTNSSPNPEYARKYKIIQDENRATTKVVQVHWKVSKTGYIKPRIEIVPVDLMGATITYATAFNAKFILDNKVGPGAEIVLIRAGDVIPYVEKVTKGTVAQMPDKKVFGEWHWNDTGVDVVLDSVSDNDDVAYQQLVAGMKTLELEHIAGSSLQKLFDAGYTKVEDIIIADVDTVERVVGSVNARKGMAVLKQKLNGVSLAKLADASNCFGRGMGERKLAKVIEAYGTLFDLTVEQVQVVDSFADKTAELVVKGAPAFKAFLKKIDGHYTIKSDVKKVAASGKLTGTVWCFTGFRDKEAAARIEELGGTYADGVGKNTTHVVTTDKTKITGKLEKAQKFGAKILDVADLKKELV